MLNAEAWKNEILKRSSGLSNGLYEVIYELCKEDTDNSVYSIDDVFRWLLKDYKHPLLSEDEKSYIKKICEPYRNFEVSVTLKKGNKLQIHFHNYMDKSGTFEIPLDYCEYKFEGLDIDRYYLLKKDLKITYDN